MRTRGESESIFWNGYVAFEQGQEDTQHFFAASLLFSDPNLVKWQFLSFLTGLPFNFSSLHFFLARNLC